MSEWKETTLGEVADIDSGFPFKSKEYTEEGNLRVVRGKNVTVGNMRWGSDAKFWDYPTQGLERYFLTENDIVIGMDGSKIGENRSKIKESDLPAILAQRVGRVRAKGQNSQEFLWHAINSDGFVQYIKSIHTGTSIPHISQKQIGNFEIQIPPPSEQHSIAEVLSSLDDKIDLLHRQNQTLEQMAETLFRQWFVEEADEGWEEINIESLFEVRDGTHDSPKKQDLGKKLITSRHLKTNYIDFENAYFISEEDYLSVNKRSKVEKGDILFSMIGTIGNLYLEESDNIDYAIKNIGLFKTSQNPKWRYFTYLWLKSELGSQFIHENRSGSTQEYISLGNLRSIVFYVESEFQVGEFNSVVNELFMKIKSNQTQIRTLTALRDTLLPKLMSGEVRVVS
jgi:type I restriction enzyme S subunit